MRFALAALLMLAACTSPASEGTAATQPATPTVHPVSGLQLVDLSITTAQGKVHKFRVEVAATPESQSQGLMFRTAMGANEGMIFPRNPPRPASFWMKNTVIPLDLVFVGPDGKILNIAANAVPYSLESILSDGPVSAVLELNGGRAAELGLAPGDTVAWEGDFW
jgi:uncharacterized protein